VSSQNEPCISSKEPRRTLKRVLYATPRIKGAKQEPCIISKEPCILLKEPSILYNEPYILSKEPRYLFKRALYTIPRIR